MSLLKLPDLLNSGGSKLPVKSSCNRLWTGVGFSVEGDLDIWKWTCLPACQLVHDEPVATWVDGAVRRIK